MTVTASEDPWIPDEPEWLLPDDDLIAAVELTTNGTGPEDGQPIFEPLREFLERKLPPAQSLMGVARGGTNLLPRYGWVLPWGREGSGKTSILVDLIFHAAAGIDWLRWVVGRPIRFVVVVNEGVPGGFQDKLAAKLEAWGGDQELVLDNIAVYASPWGEFSFRDQRMIDHARSFALDWQADYVALDPLHTLGPKGAGAPTDTEEFKHILRDFGLWEDLGVITAHHSNKAGMISGDWARHADTVIHLEKDGKNPATKFTLEKARPAHPNEQGVPALLDWNVETMSYTHRELDTGPKVTDEELLERIVTHLNGTSDAPSMGELKASVEGDSNRIGMVARAALERGELVNVSKDARRYAFRTFDPSVAYSAIAPASSQTRMDTGVNHTDPPSVDKPLSAASASMEPDTLTDPLPSGGGKVSVIGDSALDEEVF